MHKRIVSGFAGRSQSRAGRSACAAPATWWTLRVGHSDNGTRLWRMFQRRHVFGNSAASGVAAWAARSAGGGGGARLDAGLAAGYSSRRTAALAELWPHHRRRNHSRSGRPHGRSRRHDHPHWNRVPRFILSPPADGCSPNATASSRRGFTLAATDSRGRGNIAIDRTGHAAALIGRRADFLEPRPESRRC